ncbi:MAG TPA: RIP metalloprotease RseP [Bacillota bacterium]
MTLLVTVLVLGGLIFVHELGHFLAAKRAGVHIHEFALGFGPTVVSVRRGETTYALRLLPLGGFVRMAGMHPEEEDLAAVPENRRFMAKRVSQRLGIVGAGPLANLFTSVVLFIVVFGLLGIPIASLTIAEVEPGYPAQEAGLEPGDRIVAVDGEPIDAWEQLVEVVRANPGQELVVTVRRGDATLDLPVTPRAAPDGGYGVIGIRPRAETRHYGLAQSVAEGFAWTGRVVVAFVNALAGMIGGNVEGQIVGPVGIGAEIGQATQRGLPNLVFLTALLSANLGLINLLPVPALDGSRMVFLVLEGLRGRPIDPNKEGLIHLLGFALMLALLLVVSVRDVARIFGAG